MNTCSMVLAVGVLFAPFVCGQTSQRAREAVSNQRISRLFSATVEATEEAIVNAMVAAKTMTGIDNHTVIGLPHDQLQKALKKYNRRRAGADSIHASIRTSFAPAILRDQHSSKRTENFRRPNFRKLIAEFACKDFFRKTTPSLRA
jgi:Peptidase family S58